MNFEIANKLLSQKHQQNSRPLPVNECEVKSEILVANFVIRRSAEQRLRAQNAYLLGMVMHTYVSARK